MQKDLVGVCQRTHTSFQTYRNKISTLQEVPSVDNSVTKTIKEDMADKFILLAV